MATMNTTRPKGRAHCRPHLAGETCAIVSDAGMPAISDPGEDLVALCAEHDDAGACCAGRAPSFPRWRYRDCRRADSFEGLSVKKGRVRTT